MKRIRTDDSLLEMQRDLTNGMSYPDIALKHKTSRSNVCKYISKGLLIKPDKKNVNQYTMGREMSFKTKQKIRIKMMGKKLSEETKKKISISRLRYLEEHPDEVPYKLNHSSKKSYPEIVFENALNSNNIKGWTYNYRNGVYSYDFAWPEQKIDVEIDGGTHLSEKVKRIDERRDIFSKSKGWMVLRFTAKEVKDDVTKCVNKLKENLRMCNSTGLE